MRLLIPVAIACLAISASAATPESSKNQADKSNSVTAASTNSASAAGANASSSGAALAPQETARGSASQASPATSRAQALGAIGAASIPTAGAPLLREDGLPVTPTSAAAGDAVVLRRAQDQVDRIKNLVDTGALPRVRLDMAQRSLEDAQDEATLRRSLYGNLKLEQSTKVDVDTMVSAAQRLYDRQKARLDEAQNLVNSGVAARGMLTPILEDLDSRAKTLELAKARAKLFDELTATAKLEAEAENLTRPGSKGPIDDHGAIAHKFEGGGVFSATDFEHVAGAFQAKFGKTLPISAFGETAVHRALGFDHRGRVDVALNPDQAEGVWLRSYMESHNLPYFTFRAAIAGSATGPHIHMGPPSMRLSAQAASHIPLGGAPRALAPATVPTIAVALRPTKKRAVARRTTKPVQQVAD